MEIEGLEPKKGDAEREAEEKGTSEIVDALAEAERTVGRQEAAERAAEKAREDPLSGPVDVGSHVDGDAILKSADSATDFSESSDAEVEEPSEDDKKAFMKALVSGSRYERPFSLFGGAVTGVFRSRTIGESEAIALYTRRYALSTSGIGISEYGDLVRLCLIAACVKELDGVQYPEFRDLGSMKYVETAKGMDEPGWVKQLDVWRAKPEVFASVLISEFNKFEAKYQAMVRRASDANFWKTGPSTAE